MPHEPTTELPKAYDPALIEQKWANFWVDEKIFNVPTPPQTPVISTGAQRSGEIPVSAPAHAGTPFVQLLPPPNVTGRLHMGHMLNQTEMDILTRWRRMSGSTAVWVPGTDHAGIATQMMVERQLAAEGKKRTDFSREAFTEKVWAWKHQYGSAITDQMKRLGASVDWSREYFTMDDRLNVAVREAFVRLYEQGLIYRGAYIVNWDPQLQSAVSDLEVESEERLGKLYSIRYPLVDGTGSIVIATTRPETMLGDVAVAVNPADERYKHLIGKSLKLPLADREIPILADDWANPEFGTGAVKVTPAHDPNDFAIGQRHNLPNITVFDKTAHIDLVGSPFHGLERFEARKQIVEQLEAAGLLVEVKEHAMTLPISQRTGVIIEPRLSLQWFVAVNKKPKGWARPFPTGANFSGSRNSIAEGAIAAVREGHIKFTPEMYTKTYNEWMTNIHDWCISRQLWWGHRIPAWHCEACKHIIVSRTAPTICTNCSNTTTLVQDPDVLDTWFSSGLLPFTVFGWPGANKESVILSGARSAESKDPENADGPHTAGPFSTITPDLAAFYPTTLLVTGFDILFFWVARMIMLGTHFMLDVPMPDGSPRTLADAVPFRNVYIHALVRDADRQKMSKTKGNVIDPIEIVKKYGTDAVRFTLASQASPGTDIAFNEARTEGYRAFANKIWNAARFLQMQIDLATKAGYTVTLSSTPYSLLPIPSSEQSSLTPLETRWIAARLHTVAAEVDRALAAYRFDEAANAVYQFFWGEFCDWYLELVKLRLKFEGAGFREQGVKGTLDPKPYTLNPETQLTLNALVTVFESALRLLSPFMPFLTEELWHALYATIGQASPAKSVALTRYPQASDYPEDPEAVTDLTTLQELIVTVRSVRKETAVPEKEFTPIQIFSSGNATTLAAANADMLSKLARVSAVEIVAAAPTGNNARSTPGFDVAIVYERQIDVPAERERLLKDIAKYEKGLEAANKQLGNEGFIARAPAHIVEGLKKQSAETQALYDKAKAALEALSPA
jgi:valyl-tRNA synthetase